MQKRLSAQSTVRLHNAFLCPRSSMELKSTCYVAVVYVSAPVIPVTHWLFWSLKFINFLEY